MQNSASVLATEHPVDEALGLFDRIHETSRGIINANWSCGQRIFSKIDTFATQRHGQSKRPQQILKRNGPIGTPCHKADPDNAALKKGTRLIWLSPGVDDGLIASTRSTVDILKKHGFDPIFNESQRGHTWFNWRDYLYEFAQQLFQ